MCSFSYIPLIFGFYLTTRDIKKYYVFHSIPTDFSDAGFKRIIYIIIITINIYDCIVGTCDMVPLLGQRTPFQSLFSPFPST